ncbi:MAG: alpha/beta fold hydrolase [Bacteroidia bacterium]|nr:alpha/beta fold hydrolase [Bacteroidia bacterium]
MRILHSLIQGMGPDLIILHGFLGLGDNWKSHGKKLAETGYRVHLVDQRNHGRSFWDDEFSYELLTVDLINYMDHHDIEKAIFLGHSMGGKTVMHFACAYPERCAKLIVADIAPRYYPPHHQHIIDGLQSLTPADLGSRSEADKALARQFDEVGLRAFLLKNLYRQTPDTLAFRFNLDVLSNNLDMIGEPLSGTEQYPGPTLFLRGEYSEYVVEADHAVIQAHFPLAQIATVSAAGHWLHAENPEGFQNELLAFLKQG